MLVNYQKNYNQSALQSFKSSFIKLSETGASRQASLVKKVALAVINLLLIPFRLAQGAYRLLKVKLEPKRGFFNHVFASKTSIRELNQSTILKTALVGVGAAGLIAFGHKPSASSSQVDLLSNISSLVLKIGSLPVIYSLMSFAFKREKKPTEQIEEISSAMKTPKKALEYTPTVAKQHETLAPPVAMAVASAYYNPPSDSFQPNNELFQDPSVIIDIDRRSIVDIATHIEKLKLPKLPIDLVFKISNEYLDERSAASFNIATRLNRKEAIRRKNALAAGEVCKISNSRECSELFAQILNSRSLSSITKLDSIKSHLQTEVNNFNIAKDQIDFADKLVAKLKELFPNDETLNKLEKSIKTTKALEISEITKANAINAAIISELNSDGRLKNAASLLDLSKTKLHKMWQHAEKLSNIGVLKLDFSMESLNSIVTFVKGVRKSYIAEAQIDFADKLVAELERHFPENNILKCMKESLESIKDETSPLIVKAEEINNTIIDHLNADSSDNPIKYELKLLNLSFTGLKAILPCISEFPNLEQLHLINNQLTELPESIGGLTNLVKLYLNNNQLTVLPETIGGLTNLGTLSLGENQLKVLPKSIVSLTSLRYLYLNNNQLTLLPKSIVGLTKLWTLNLNNNQLTVLPESIGGLTNLKDLSLENNQLTELPKSIGRLTELWTLNLNNNQLTLLPESIGRLTKLLELHLNDNKLTLLPKSICGLTNLQNLNLNNNQLTVLPESIGGLKRLMHLNLNNNQLTVLPKSIVGLTNLSGLYLNNNQLKVLPKSIVSLTSLRYLYLNNNQLTELSESIGGLTNLQNLNLNNNQLTVLPESIGRLTNLSDLYLNNNQLTVLPESIDGLTDLIYLHLNNNQLTVLPESIGSLTELWTLNLNNNQLTVLPESIGRLKRLMHLNLNNNQLTVLPESIGGLTDLSNLNLNNNQLTVLPKSIGGLTNLRNLNLNNNQLTELPENMDRLIRLWHLYLNNNHFATIPNHLHKLNRFVEIYLDGNNIPNVQEKLRSLGFKVAN